MKKISVEKKFVLNKETIVNLTDEEKRAVRGGDDTSRMCTFECPPTTG